MNCLFQVTVRYIELLQYLWIIVGFSSSYPLLIHMVKLTYFYAAVNGAKI